MSETSFSKKVSELFRYDIIGIKPQKKICLNCHLPAQVLKNLTSLKNNSLLHFAWFFVHDLDVDGVFFDNSVFFPFHCWRI